ncbi:MAG: hypothetical protein Q7S10_02375 [bacterium]|nr:hypothetical protein [bacterium]
MAQKRIGFDIGGPIIDMANDWGQDASSQYDLSNYLETPAVPGAFAAVRQLVEKFGSENVFLLSVRRLDSRDKTLHWLDQHGFFEQTKVRRENVHFCLKRSEKGIIGEQLGFDIYVDDKLENLGHMHTVAERILFRPEAEEVRKFSEFLPLVWRVDSWQEILQKYLP